MTGDAVESMTGLWRTGVGSDLALDGASADAGGDTETGDLESVLGRRGSEGRFTTPERVCP